MSNAVFQEPLDSPDSHISTKVGVGLVRQGDPVKDPLCLAELLKDMAMSNQLTLLLVTQAVSAVKL